MVFLNSRQVRDILPVLLSVVVITKKMPEWRVSGYRVKPVQQDVSILINGEMPSSILKRRVRQGGFTLTKEIRISGLGSAAQHCPAGGADIRKNSFLR
ncbi:hypothetical protein MED297_07361 [Reinekea sp. MED297]|uniref:Uncharacterized protein n=1 Tax=Reinekea blandensis MED297 TaxID=314283 RepID=A4BIG3_9GAMM|nr:hypothetical protein MED297_07361 [Reinekea sp. MED297] [Reinekea blandensis MED297]